MKSIMLLLWLFSIVELESNLTHFLNQFNLRLVNQREGTKTTRIIQGDLSYTNEGLQAITISVGNPPQRFTLALDFTSELLFLPKQYSAIYSSVSNAFNPNTESFRDSKQKRTLDNVLGHCEGTYVTSIFGLFDQSFDTFEWLLCTTFWMRLSGKDGLIGLNRNISEATSASNLLSRLFYRTDLPHKVISFRPPTKDYPSPQLFIGNYDKDFSQKNVTRAYHKLAVIQKEELRWQMSNFDLVFGDYSYPFNVVNKTFVNGHLEFRSDYAIHNFPYGYIDYFLKYFPSNCHKEVRTENLEMINCPNRDLAINVSFQINNSLVLLPKSTLWDKNPETQEDRLLIVFAKKIDQIFLSIDFFKHYHILFSHENNSVIFHPLNDGNVLELNYQPSKPIPPEPEQKPDPKPEPDQARDSYFWVVLGIIIGVIAIGIIITSVVIALQNQTEQNNHIQPWLNSNNKQTHNTN